jgi:uncharacterized protein
MKLAKILIIILVVAVSFALLQYKTTGSVTPSLQKTEKEKGTESPKEPLPTITVKDKTLSIEIADTEDKRSVGLGGRSALDENTGMLFTWNVTNIRPVFWMKDMLIPLDILWIKNGRIVQIDENIDPPDPQTPDSDLQRFTPDIGVDFILEVNGGWSERNGIEVGDSVETFNL